MPRYYFDTHAGSLSEWDDDGTEAVDPDEAIAHGKYMLAVVIGDIARLGGDQHAVITIRDQASSQIATLTGTGSSEPRIVRSPQFTPA